MKDLEKAKIELEKEGYTCVLCKEDTFYYSKERGVKPLVKWLDEGVDLKGFCAADKVIGKATAFLYVLHDVKEVYAGVISQTALEVFVEHGIRIKYGELVSYIQNRSKDGMCPFEETVLNIREANEAYKAIRLKMQDMGIK